VKDVDPTERHSKFLNVAQTLIGVDAYWRILLEGGAYLLRF